MGHKRAKGFFGEFGGRYTAEVLQAPLAELEAGFREAAADPEFRREYEAHLADYVGRPTPLLEARRASEALGGARIYIKMEGLANTGAHKINNALGQALLVKRMGKGRVIAETGAGQHGVAAAAACARLGLECRVYMGEEDIRRQHPNVVRMHLFGAEVIPVTSGSRTLKDAVNEALRDWSASYGETHYLLGSALGPAPYPEMVRFFQGVIGRETRQQLADRQIEPDLLAACVGGGSNAVGFFAPYLDEPPRHPDSESGRGGPRLLGVEAGGTGLRPGEHAARMAPGTGKPGIVHGYKSLFLTDAEGQVMPTHSVSAGLDYPGIGPELAQAGRSGRVDFTTASDGEALEAVRFFAGTEGILMALESAHAAAAVRRLAPGMGPEEAVVMNMSGSGDKDIFITAPRFEREDWVDFLKKEAERHGG